MTRSPGGNLGEECAAGRAVETCGPRSGDLADWWPAARSTTLLTAVPHGADFARPQTATPGFSGRRPPVGDDPRSRPTPGWVGSRAGVRAAGTCRGRQLR